MVQDLISVIIPAYNVDPYVEKCVASVLAQTWKNLEIILIDDGSKDKTGAICDQLAEQHSNITVYHQENAGLSVARNVGIEHSHGSWIAFLDSDDWIEPKMYETLHDLAIRKGTLLASCLSRDCLMGQVNEAQGDGTEHLLNYEEMIRDLNFGTIMRPEVWNKLWHRDLIAETRFIPGQVAEDVHFDRILFAKAEKVAHINKVMHNYLISRPGNTNTTFKKARLCIFEEFRQWKNELADSGRLSSARNISGLAAHFAVDIYGNAERTKQDKEILQELKRYFDLFYPDAKGADMSGRRKLKLFLFHLHPAIWGLLLSLKYDRS